MGCKNVAEAFIRRDDTQVFNMLAGLARIITRREQRRQGETDDSELSEMQQD